GAIHLLVTDLVMPMMSGRELARRARLLSPTLPVLFISGYAPPADIVFGAGETFLPKPFESSALLRTVREVLAAAPSPAASRSAGWAGGAGGRAIGWPGGAAARLPLAACRVPADASPLAARRGPVLRRIAGRGPFTVGGSGPFTVDGGCGAPAPAIRVREGP